jgi:hypothetical protein
VSQHDARECWLLASLAEADAPARLPGLLRCLGGVCRVESGGSGAVQELLAAQAIDCPVLVDEPPLIVVAFAGGSLVAVLTMLLQAGCSDFRRLA